MTGFSALIPMLNPAYGHHIRGSISDENSKPIAYVNIGIENTYMGTMSVEDGSYDLNVENAPDSGKVLFSCLGFVTKSVSISELKFNPNVTLKSLTIVLPEMVIQTRNRIISKSGTSPGIAPGGTSLMHGDGGSAMALLIESNVRNGLLAKAYINILDNEMDTFRIRFRVYKRDSIMGCPGTEVTHQNIIVSSSQKKGELPIDLTPFDIHVAGDFFIAFEWLYKKKTLERVRQFENAPLPWLVGDISNNKMIVRDDNGKVIRKVKMTPSQLEDLEKRKLPRTYFRTRSAVTTRHTGYLRKSSFAPWEPCTEDILVAGVEIEHDPN